jgi:hypothetical protein
VHLIVRRAVAVVSDPDERRPNLGFTVPSEMCCPVPALPREPALWDAVTFMESSVITVAVLLLRHRAEPVALCRRTIADLLDADEGTIGPVLLEFERLGAVRPRSGRIAVTQVEILKSTVAAARRERTRDRDRRRAER